MKYLLDCIQVNRELEAHPEVHIVPPGDSPAGFIVDDPEAFFADVNAVDPAPQPDPSGRDGSVEFQERVGDFPRAGPGSKRHFEMGRLDFELQIARHFKKFVQNALAVLRTEDQLFVDVPERVGDRVPFAEPPKGDLPEFINRLLKLRFVPFGERGKAAIPPLDIKLEEYFVHHPSALQRRNAFFDLRDYIQAKHFVDEELKRASPVRLELCHGIHGIAQLKKIGPCIGPDMIEYPSVIFRQAGSPRAASLDFDGTPHVADAIEELLPYRGGGGKSGNRVPVRRNPELMADPEQELVLAVYLVREFIREFLPQVLQVDDFRQRVDEGRWDHLRLAVVPGDGEIEMFGEICQDLVEQVPVLGQMKAFLAFAARLAEEKLGMIGGRKLAVNKAHDNHHLESQSACLIERCYDNSVSVFLPHVVPNLLDRRPQSIQVELEALMDRPSALESQDIQKLVQKSDELLIGTGVLFYLLL